VSLFPQVQRDCCKLCAQQWVSLLSPNSGHDCYYRYEDTFCCKLYVLDVFSLQSKSAGERDGRDGDQSFSDWWVSCKSHCTICVASGLCQHQISSTINEQFTLHSFMHFKPCTLH
jgi:hypothetical protein